MRRISYPEAVDDFALPMNRPTRNALIEESEGLTIQCLAYAVVELERRLGTLSAEDPTSLEYRLQQIEAALGISAEAPTVPPVTTEGIYTDQWQAGIMWLYSDSGSVEFLLPLAELSAYYVRAYSGAWNVEITTTYTASGLVFTAAVGGSGPLSAVVEWAVNGTLETETGVTAIEGTVAADRAGASVVFATPFGSVNDYAVYADGAGGGWEVEVRVEKAADQVTFYPAIDGTTVTYKVIQVTQ